jgi:hypothetical protein
VECTDEDGDSVADKIHKEQKDCTFGVSASSAEINII